MVKRLTKQQLKILQKNMSPDRWEYFCDCGVCQYMKRMDFAGDDRDFESLKKGYLEEVRLGNLKGDEIDLELLEKDLMPFEDRLMHDSLSQATDD